MDQLLIDLLNKLTKIDEDYGDLTATDIREAMFDYVWSGFLMSDGSEPERGELYIDDEDVESAVWGALQTYVTKAAAIAKAQGMNFKERLAAFQGADVETEDGMTCDEFFGWIDPDEYDDDGNPA